MKFRELLCKYIAMRVVSMINCFDLKKLISDLNGVSKSDSTKHFPKANLIVPSIFLKQIQQYQAFSESKSDSTKHFLDETEPVCILSCVDYMNVSANSVELCLAAWISVFRNLIGRFFNNFHSICLIPWTKLKQHTT